MQLVYRNKMMEPIVICQAVYWIMLQSLPFSRLF